MFSLTECAGNRYKSYNIDEDIKLLILISFKVQEFGHFTHACQADIVCKSDVENVPYFNAPIYTAEKEQIGKVDEIFGTIRNYYVSVKLSDTVNAKSFKPNQKVCAHTLSLN